MPFENRAFVRHLEAGPNAAISCVEIDDFVEEVEVFETHVFDCPTVPQAVFWATRSSMRAQRFSSTK